ncbi:hypothetical protein [Niallia taxi]|nr:hypothetical protein [Niallia taxi]
MTKGEKTFRKTVQTKEGRMILLNEIVNFPFLPYLVDIIMVQLRKI